MWIIMKLHSLVRSKGLTDKLNRRGRGNASWRGNFSGRWCNGQKSRSGHSMKPFLEWGQTSVVMRMPKHRGFKRYYKLVTPVQTVNLGKLWADERVTEIVTKESLLQLWYIRSTEVAVKILWTWDFGKALSFEGIEHFSATAKEKIEKAGWSIK